MSKSKGGARIHTRGTVRVVSKPSKTTTSVQVATRRASTASTETAPRKSGTHAVRVVKRSKSYAPKPFTDTIFHTKALAPVVETGTVVVSLPVFNARGSVRKAAESILAQYHKDVIVVAVSDADPHHSLEALKGVKDPRLVRFEVPRNRGPYYIHDLVLRASEGIAPLFGIQDADDWSPNTRLRDAIQSAITHKADASFGGSTHVGKGKGDGVNTVGYNPQLWRYKPPSQKDHPLLVHLAHHAAGVMSHRAMMKMGGYYAGTRVGFDTAVQRALVDIGRVVFTGGRMYHRVITPNSLTTSSKTGHRSQHRAKAKVQLRGMLESTLRRHGSQEARLKEWNSLVTFYAARTEEDDALVAELRAKILKAR